MFEAFDMIRVVSLPQRRDRRAQMRRQLARAGLANDPRVAFFDAVRPDDAGPFTSIGAHGCYQSHCAILAEAVETNASVLILEDDCDLIDDIGSVALPSGWDIFYGGYTAVTPTDLANSDIVGSHMMGFSREGARGVLDYLRQIRPDGIHPPIDAAYIWYRRAHPNVPTHFADPPVGHQRPSRSDIEPGRFDRVSGLRVLVEWARRVRHRVLGGRPVEMRHIKR